ncbi:hypothetical protein AY599_03520 [Leptolyngbya valderiana BDU 20041]|nr:hypothetical protein AY599_03520 [Leptolyngbya valderiana BDU 20041]
MLASWYSLHQRIFMAGRSIICIVLAFHLAGCASRPDCAPISGFELGRDGEGVESSCSGERYGEAWRLGQTLGALEAELRQLQQASALDASQQQRLRILQREIPELETLARLEGWLPAEGLGGPPD